jgi:hypothetical protein
MYSEGNVLKIGHEIAGIFCTSFIGGQRYLAKHNVMVLEHPHIPFVSAEEVAEKNNWSTVKVIEKWFPGMLTKVL